MVSRVLQGSDSGWSSRRLQCLASPPVRSAAEKTAIQARRNFANVLAELDSFSQLIQQSAKVDEVETSADVQQESEVPICSVPQEKDEAKEDIPVPKKKPSGKARKVKKVKDLVKVLMQVLLDDDDEDDLEA